jgi:hypothetical protein
MSSRTLRRAQKELEERQRLESLAQQESDEESDGEIAPTKKGSLFAMLGQAEEADEDEVEEEEDDGGDVNHDPEPVITSSNPAKRNKKKKKRGKGKQRDNTPASTDPRPSKSSSALDEIDKALLALNLTTNKEAQREENSLTSAVSEEKAQLFSVLSVDTQYLQASTEMRKLFGRAALQGEHDAEPAGRRRGRGQPRGGIAGAVAGNTPGNRNLASLAFRRNIFIQGKEEWPRATSGGLAMEVVERRSDGCVEYRFVHNTTYQSVQRQFDTCVASMDPERMIQLLHFNRKSPPRSHAEHWPT